MTGKHSEGSAVVVVVLLVMALLFGIVLLVAAAGYFWYRASYQRALRAEVMAREAMEEARLQQAMAEVEAQRARHDRSLTESNSSAHPNEVGRTTIEEQLDLTQAQLDETRRIWKEIVDRTDGQLTPEDTAAIDRQFDKLQEQLQQMEQVLQ